MVISRRNETVYWAKATKDLDSIESEIMQILYEKGFREKLTFPSYSELNVFTNRYDDIKMEYLVDFSNSKDKEYCFVPEYRTLIKDYSDLYLKAITNYSFYYIQNTLSYTSIERTNIKEDKVIGFCVINPTDVSEQWTKIAKTFSEISKFFGGNQAIINFNSNHTMDAFLPTNTNPIQVGFGKNEFNEGILSAHFSISDIFQCLKK